MNGQKEVLIVEDDEANMVFLAQVLEDHGFRFRVAKNGKEALAALGRRRPDLVLLDIMMPRKSGVHVFKEMKQEPDLADVPIIITTGATVATGVNVKTGEQEPATTDGDVVARCLGSLVHQNVKDLQADAFMEKPLEPKALIAKIRELIG